jgi:hypothetical protein
MGARALALVPEYPRSVPRAPTRSRKRPPKRAGQVALRRVIDLAYDWADEYKTGELEHGWRSFAARKMGSSRTRCTSCSTRTTRAAWV